jgi:hypothetical protein
VCKTAYYTILIKEVYQTVFVFIIEVFLNVVIFKCRTAKGNTFLDTHIIFVFTSTPVVRGPYQDSHGKAWLLLSSPSSWHHPGGLAGEDGLG